MEVTLLRVNTEKSVRAEFMSKTKPGEIPAQGLMANGIWDEADGRAGRRIEIRCVVFVLGIQDRFHPGSWHNL